MVLYREVLYRFLYTGIYIWKYGQRNSWRLNHWWCYFLVLETIPIRLLCIIFVYPCKTKGQMKEKTSQLCFPMTVSLLTPISFLLCCRMLEFTAAPPSSAVHTTNCINSLFLSGAKKKKKSKSLAHWNWNAPDGIGGTYRLMKPSVHRSFHKTETDREETWHTFVSSTERKAPIPTVLKICYRLSCKQKTFTPIPPTPTLSSGQNGLL